MAVFDASGSGSPILFQGNSAPANLLDFLIQLAATPTLYQWETPGGHRVSATGSFSLAGPVVTGTVDAINIDFTPTGSVDVSITGIGGVALSDILAGHDALWRTIFSGDDTFILATSRVTRLSGDERIAAAAAIGGNDLFEGTLTFGGFVLVGDHWVPFDGTSQGGDDVVQITGTLGLFNGAPVARITGDTDRLISGQTYFGGNDLIEVTITNGGAGEVLGDANRVEGTAALTGGNDTIVAATVDDWFLSGDLRSVDLTGANMVGGDDQITGRGRIMGDAETVLAGSLTGGNDLITLLDGSGSEAFGDVYEIAASSHSGDQIVGGDDTILGGDQADLLVGDVFRIDGGASVTFGNDVIYGFDGNDTIHGDYAEDLTGTIAPGEGGDDSLFGGGGRDLIFGGGGRDFIRGGNGADTIEAGNGADTVYGGSQADRIYGGGGGDLIFGDNDNPDGGGQGNDTIFGGNGPDTIHGEGGNDELHGDDGDDLIFGGDGDDVILGGEGNDTIHPGAGADQVDGGDGVNTLSYAGSDAGVTVSISANTASGGHAEGDQIAGFHVLIGSAYDDTLTGIASLGHVLFGGDGADVLNMSLVGQPDDFGLFGGDGDDSLRLNGPGPAVGTIDGGDGTDRLVLNASGPMDLRTAQLLSIEELAFSNLADQIADLDAAQFGPGGLPVDLLVSGGNGNNTLNIRLSDPGSFSAAAFQVSEDGWHNPSSPDDRIALHGSDGNDTLVGSEASDILYGGDGDDDLFNFGQRAGAPAGALYGGDGDDILRFAGDVGAATLDGGQGRDTLTLASDSGAHDLRSADLLSIEVLAFGAAYHMIDVNDTQFGAGGLAPDLELLGSTVDVELGVRAVNIFLTAPGSFSIAAFQPDAAWLADGGMAGGHSVAIHGTADADTMIGSIGADRLVGNGGPDLLEGGDGKDSLYGGAGADTLHGEAGNDLIFGDEGGDLAYGGGGRDILYGGTGDDTLHGDGGDDVILGGNDNDLLYGGNGEDHIQGNDGDDTIYGGRDSDTIQGGAGNDLLYGDGGGDEIEGNLGDDTLYGGGGADTLYGGQIGEPGNNLIYGGGGADLAFGAEGDDEIYGGDGNDTLWGDRLGGLGNDTLYGGRGDDELYGGRGDDDLRGGDGRDTLFGDEGNDVLRGGGSRDSIWGGFGDDTIYGGAAADIIYAGADNDLVYGGDGDDFIDGGAGDDVLYGDDGNDTIYGVSGNDTLYGGAGRDLLYAGSVGISDLYGGGGDDVLSAGSGEARMYGGGGDDLLYSGNGADVMTGGNGSDRFVFTPERIGTGAQSDRITDFETGVDVIQISATVTLTFIGTDPFSGTAGEVRFNDTAGALQGDITGNGSLDFRLFLDGVTTLDENDFVFLLA